MSGVMPLPLGNPDYVAIEPYEWVQCRSIGRARTEANIGKGDAAEYDREAMMPDPEGNVMTVLCEFAVAKYTGENWTGMGAWSKEDHYKYKHLPDVGDDIEVRMIVRGPGPKIRDHETDGYLFCARLHGDTMYTTEVEMVGWISMREGQQVKQPHRNGRYHYVPIEALYSPSSWPRKVRVKPVEQVQDAMSGRFVMPGSPVFEVIE